MARFYVGQRVRIKWSVAWPFLNGREGTIICRAPKRPRAPADCAWDVLPDGFMSNLFPLSSEPNGFAYFSPAEDQLEPATDSYDKTSWDECLWKPGHLREKA